MSIRCGKHFARTKIEIAAIILEPMPANAGLYFPRDNFLSILREECTKHGALLIFDEVMTGFRVARGGAQEIYGIKPDLTALGKVIGGGLPVGAFGGRAEIMDQLAPDGPVYQAGTLSGNPLAMAAGLAQLRELERIDGWKLLEELGAQFEKLARDAIAQAKIDITFHRIGSMFCLFFAAGPIVDLAGAQRSDLKMFAKFFHACLKRGVYFAPSQFETGFISTAHSAEDIERTRRVVRERWLRVYRLRAVQRSARGRHEQFRLPTGEALRRAAVHGLGNSRCERQTRGFAPSRNSFSKATGSFLSKA